MVCFVIELSVGKSEREMNNEAIQRRILHLARHCNADIQKTNETSTRFYYRVQLCDADAVSLLRDMPQPFHVQQITLLHSKQVLYVYRKHETPPPIPLLKSVYWLAKSTERWKL